MDTVHLSLVRLIQFRIQYVFYKLRSFSKGGEEASEPADAVRSHGLDSVSEESPNPGADATNGGGPATTTNDDGKGDEEGDLAEVAGESKGELEMNSVLSNRSLSADLLAPATAHNTSRPPRTRAPIERQISGSVDDELTRTARVKSPVKRDYFKRWGVVSHTYTRTLTHWLLSDNSEDVIRRLRVSQTMRECWLESYTGASVSSTTANRLPLLPTPPHPSPPLPTPQDHHG